MSFQYAIRRNDPVQEQRDRELEDYLAASTATPWIEFTPEWTGYTRGNGTFSAEYRYVGRSIELYVNEVRGSTSSITASPATLAIPNGEVARPPQFSTVGDGQLRDASASKQYPMQVRLQTSSALALYYLDSSTLELNFTTSALPFTWATGDEYRLRATVPIN